MTPAREHERHDDAATRAAAVVGVVLLAAVWIRFHSWETYLYAASTEGFLQPSQMFSAAQGNAALADVSRFHPYHPLWHALVGALWRTTAWGFPGASALTVAVVVNKLSAAAALVVAWRIFRVVLGGRAAALFATAGLFFTKAFLFGAYSGEAHMAALPFLLGAVYVTLRDVTADPPKDAREADRDDARNDARNDARSLPPAPLSAPKGARGMRGALVAALLFSTGAALNLAGASFGLAHATLYLSARRFRELVVFCAVCGAVLVGAYIVAPMVLLDDVRSLDGLLRVFRLYADLPRQPPPLAEQPAELVAAVATGVVGGVGVVSSAAKVVVAALVVSGAIALRRSRAPRHVRLLLGVWLGGFVAATLATQNVRAVNGILWVLLPMLAFVGLAFHASAGRVWLRTALVTGGVAIAAYNFAEVVVRKTLPADALRPHVASVVDVPASDTPVAVLLTHLSLTQEAYALGHDLGLREQTVFMPQVPASADALRTWMRTRERAREPFCLLSARAIPGEGLSGTSRRQLVARTQVLEPGLYHYSVNHPEAQLPTKKSTHLACWRAPPQ